MRIPLTPIVLSLSLVAAACGRDPEGGASDGTPTPAGESVTVTVFDDGTPLAGAAVVFHDTDGHPSSETVTDAAGEATGTGSMVTVVRGTPGERRLETVMGVEPGDTLVFGFPEKRAGAAGTVRVQAPSAVANAGDYVIDAGCADTTAAVITSPVDLAVTGECVRGGSPLSVLAVSRAEDGTPYSYALAEHVELGGDGIADVTLGAWSLEWGDVFLTVSDFPAGLLGARANVAAVSDGEAFYAVTTPTVMPGYEGSTGTAMFPYPVDLGDAYEYVVSLGYGEGSTVSSESVLVARDAQRPENLAMPASDFLPAIRGASFANGRVLTWQDESAFHDTSSLTAYLAWGPVRWSVLAPPETAGELTLPSLPDSVDVPSGAATSATIAVADPEFLDGYGAVKSFAGPSVLEVALPDGDARMRFVLGAAAITP